MAPRDKFEALLTFIHVKDDPSTGAFARRELGLFLLKTAFGRDWST
jgi:hypothetical protein